MKYFLCLFLALFVVNVYSQQKVISLKTIRPEFITVALDSTTSSIVYYIYPPPAGDNSPNRTAISTTAPTSASLQAKNLEYNAEGALTISLVTDTLTAEESDSLYGYVQTLIYDDTKAAWYRATNDTLFLDFDTPGTYTGTSIDYLDWTHGSCYVAELGGSIMPGAGLAITLGQHTDDNAGAATTLYVGFWWLR